MSEQISEEKWGEIKAALFNGQKIEAIKLYRACSGQGLKESKEAIDALEKELRTASPELFKASAAKGGGCLGVLLCAGGLAYVICG